MPEGTILNICSWGEVFLHWRALFPLEHQVFYVIAFEIYKIGKIEDHIRTQNVQISLEVGHYMLLLFDFFLSNLFGVNRKLADTQGWKLA